MSDPELEPPAAPSPPPDWRERIAAATGIEWSPARLAAAAVAAIVAVVAAWMLVRPGPAPPPPEVSLPRASPPASTSTTTGEVVVHAAGAVVVPGLYRLPPGARVADLIDAAGGLAADADPSAVNLAAPLSDGERVYVTRAGEGPPAGPVPSPNTGDAARAGPVNLNRATAAELETLPGVGPATSASIIAYRDEHGGFGRVEELLDVHGIGPARYEQLRPLVSV